MNRGWWHASCPKFMTSIPKSGTFLLRHILRMEWPVAEGTRKKITCFSKGICRGLPYEGWYHSYLYYSPGGHHIRGHLGYSEQVLEEAGNRIKVFLYRDPRDIIVSWARYVDQVADTNAIIRPVLGIDLKKSTDKIATLIECLPLVVAIYTEWMDADIVKIRYEELIGNPEEALAPLAKAIPEPLEYLVARSKMRASPTFRKGGTGDWHEEFKPHHIKAFEQGWGELMDTFGYLL
jgi:hypothetical protein